VSKTGFPQLEYMSTMMTGKQVFHLWITYKLSEAKKSDVYVMPDFRKLVVNLCLDRCQQPSDLLENSHGRQNTISVQFIPELFLQRYITAGLRLHPSSRFILKPLYFGKWFCFHLQE
jgi:hypothetical protein